MIPEHADSTVCSVPPVSNRRITYPVAAVPPVAVDPDHDTVISRPTGAAVGALPGGTNCAAALPNPSGVADQAASAARGARRSAVATAVAISQHHSAGPTPIAAGESLPLSAVAFGATGPVDES